MLTGLSLPAPTDREGSSVIRTRVAAVAILVAALTVPALAITAGDVLDRMKPDERNGYFDGAIEMAMYLAATQEKNDAKAECILNRFYRGDGSAHREAIATFERYKDKPAAGLLKLLIDRHCGSK